MKEKAAYLKGLIDGLGIDENTKEGKVIKAMSELLSEMAETVDSIDEDVTHAYDQINDLSEELEDLEADLYEEDDAEDEEEEDDSDDETEADDNADVAGEPYYEVACPACGKTVYVSEDDLDAGEAICPSCNVAFEVALADEDDDEAPEEPDDGPARYEVTCPACGATSVVDEEALLDGSADLAVHSIKDVPMVLPEGIVLGCVPQREICVDCLLSNRYASLDELPRGARVGTSSLRRQAQLLNLRPDLEILSLRGNVDTRLRKMKEGEYDAIVLASAGLKRLGLSADRMHHFEAASFVPAVGQGALGIECRGDDSEVLELLSRMEHRPTRICVEAERGFLAGLDGGCQVPIAGHAEMLDDDRFILDGLVAEVDGSVILREQQEGTAATARETGFALARHLLDKGGKDILDRLYAENR